MWLRETRAGKRRLLIRGMNRRAVLGDGSGATDRTCWALDSSQSVVYRENKSSIHQQERLPADAQAAADQRRAANTHAQTDADLSPGTAAPGDTWAGEAAACPSGSCASVL